MAVEIARWHPEQQREDVESALEAFERELDELETNGQTLDDLDALVARIGEALASVPGAEELVERGEHLAQELVDVQGDSQVRDTGDARRWMNDVRDALTAKAA